jgi:hypothetical protein
MTLPFVTRNYAEYRLHAVLGLTRPQMAELTDSELIDILAPIMGAFTIAKPVNS